MFKFVLSGAICVALVAFSILGFNFARSTPLDHGQPWMLIGIPNAKVPVDAENLLRNNLNIQPLDQEALNLLFAIEVRKGLEEGRRKDFAKVLRSLGWRDNATQQNLIVEAARNEDIQEAVARLDALLRRRKLVDSSMTVLRGIEQYPQATPILIERLAKGPAWRTEYFDKAATLQTNEALDARARLIQEMITEGQTLTHRELKPSLDAMVRGGQRAQAARIVTLSRPPRDTTTLNYDPDFAISAALDKSDQMRPLPLEWQLINRRGISARIEESGNEARLKLHWDGRGAPTLARTMVSLSNSRSPRLEVLLNDAADRRNLQRLQFSLRCPNEKPSFFQADASEAHAKLSSYHLFSPSPCDYPYLVIAGSPQIQKVGVKASIKTIRLLPE